MSHSTVTHADVFALLVDIARNVLDGLFCSDSLSTGPQAAFVGHVCYNGSTWLMSSMD